MKSTHTTDQDAAFDGTGDCAPLAVTPPLTHCFLACLCTPRGGVNVHRWVGRDRSDSAPYKGRADGLFAKRVTHHLVRLDYYSLGTRLMTSGLEASAWA